MPNPSLARRLRTLLEQNPQGLTTAEIRDILNTCAPASTVGDLRKLMKREDVRWCYTDPVPSEPLGLSENGRQVYRYRLAERKEVA